MKINKNCFKLKVLKIIEIVKTQKRGNINKSIFENEKINIVLN